MKVLNSKMLKYSLYYLLFSPLFFINVKDSHDWGDDFSQYIHQAGNIAEGKPHILTGYIYNPEFATIGPPTYSVGFPLMLAPIYYFWGNDILAFLIFNSLLLGCLGVLMIIFFKKFVSLFTALFLALVIVYNPWTILFKGEVLADISFSLVFLGTVLMILKLNDGLSKSSVILIGLFIAFLTLIKSMGIVMLISLFIYELLLMLIKGKLNKPTLFNLGVISLISLVVFFLLNNLLFPTGSSTLQYFKSMYSYSGIKEVFLKNLAYYINIFQAFFHPQNDIWEFIPLMIKAFALTFLMLGFINELLFKVTFLEVLFSVYILTLCFFPNSTQGFRYLLPLIPIMFYYIVLGLKSFTLKFSINKNIILVFLCIVFVVSFKNSYANILRNERRIPEGPQRREALEVFQYIKGNTLQNDTILFIKPRALSLYTGRYSFSNHPKQDQEGLKRKIIELRPKYYLLMKDIENPSLNEYLKHNNSVILKFQNSKFELYQQIR